MAKKEKDMPLTYIPRTQVDSVRLRGLLGLKAIMQEPGLLEQVAIARGQDPEELRDQFKKQVGSRDHAISGANVMFKGPPNLQRLEENHPLRSKDLVPVRVDLDRLMKDIPETRIHGMELMPYEEYDRLPKKERHFSKRHRDLTIDELAAIRARSGEDLWKHYEDIDKRGRYAPNVPHAAIITPDGVIPSSYLHFSKQGSVAMLTPQSIECFGAHLLKKEASALTLAVPMSVGAGTGLFISGLRPLRAISDGFKELVFESIRKNPKSGLISAKDAFRVAMRPSEKIREASFEALLASLAKNPINMAAAGGAGGAAVGGLLNSDDRLAGAQAGLLAGGLAGGTIGANIAPSSYERLLRKAILNK